VSDVRYVGKGQALVGIPNTDLTAAEVAALADQRGVAADELEALLVRSGLYAAKPPSKPSAPVEN
jgi:hypothetical protein